jgi:DNA-binding response OmpR family regulator
VTAPAKRWPVAALCQLVLVVPSMAQGAGLAASDSTEPVRAIISMGLVLLLAWAITRWVAQPILSRADEVSAEIGTETGTGTDEPRDTDSVEAATQLSAGDFHLDLRARRLVVRDEEVTLTSTEFDLLRYFLTHEGEALTRSDLLCEVWGHQQPVYSRTVDTHVQRLRDKLGPCRNQLETVRGVGYRLHAPIPV